MYLLYWPVVYIVHTTMYSVLTALFTGLPIDIDIESLQIIPFNICSIVNLILIRCQCLLHGPSASGQERFLLLYAITHS